MLYKTFGGTGKKISAVGFGGMRFANPRDIDANAELVRYAHGKGINYFDTAPGYCADKSEAILGAAFRRMKRETFYCSSKSMATGGDEFRAGLERSLERLTVDRIDFFHIWCLLRGEEWAERVAKGAVAAAVRARDEGLIGHVLASVHLDGPQTCRVLESGVVEGVTIPYNALNFPFRQTALQCAARLNLGVVTMNPLGGGLIARAAPRLGFLRGPGDRSVVEAAIRFNVSHPAVTCALVGFTTRQHVDEAVEAVEGFTPYPAARLEALKDHVTGRFEGFCTMCGYCLPCPADVEIPKLMDSYNHHFLGDADQAIRDKLAWHWSLSPDSAAACNDCGQCEDRCAGHLPIRQRLKHVAKLAR